MDRWGGFVYGAVAILLLPLAAVFALVGRKGEEWGHIVETVLPTYLLNTGILVVAVGLLASVFAIGPAWLVTTCRFPGRSFFRWALVLPLATPTYVAAFVYYQGPEAAIPLLVWIRSTLGVDAFLLAEKVIRYGLLIVMMAAVLSPYLFLACRASFEQQGRTVIEAARCLGASSGRVFRRVGLPLARPAIAAGLALIVMEVVNDYGAVHFFGVPTLTEGVFRTWVGMGDLTSALRLAAIIMAALLGLLLLERLFRGRRRYVEAGETEVPCAPKQLRGLRAAGAFLACVPPFVLGFLYPVGTLAHWAWLDLTSGRPAVFDALPALGRGVALALGTALVATVVAAVFVHATRQRENLARSAAARLAGLGYATPGVVVALGALIVFGTWDRWVAGGWAPLLGGTLFAIAFAYVVRFFAIPLKFSEAGFERIGRPLGEAARILGSGPAATLRRVYLPLLRGPLLAAAMLLFVDILKELPLTLILRPADFETLATTAFSLAKEARLQACAVPSLLIVATGGGGLLLMHRWLLPSR